VDIKFSGNIESFNINFNLIYLENRKIRDGQAMEKFGTTWPKVWNNFYRPDFMKTSSNLCEICSAKSQAQIHYPTIFSSALLLLISCAEN
jgi:hypothetical protein